MATLLIVEDSPLDRQIMQAALGPSHRLEFTDAGGAVTDLAKRLRPDLILLDVSLSVRNGLQVCLQLQGDTSTRPIPVFFVSGRTTHEDRIAGLSAGADDYISKPYNPLELRLRVENKLKRTQIPTSAHLLVSGKIKIDTEAQQAWILNDGSEQTLSLTPIEYRLLLFFMRNPRTVLSRKVLLEKVWGANVHVTERSVDTQIKGLRQKMHHCEHCLETVYRMGYRFDPSSVTEPSASKRACRGRCGR